MVLTQESVLSLLIAEGGKVTKSHLVGTFKGEIDGGDPAQRERNRELFRTFVNNVAVVKEIDGVRYVVVKKMYQHLLERVQAPENRVDRSGNEAIAPTGEQQRPPVRTESTEGSEGAGGGQEVAGESEENPSELLTPIELALQRTKYTDIRVKRMMNFDIIAENCSKRGAASQAAPVKSKPYALPLRMPPTRVEVHTLKADPCHPPETEKPDPHRSKKRPPSAESEGSVSSPQLRRPVKTTKSPVEPKDTRVPSLVPLEQLEHEWLVKCASGHWSQVYGLLLRDSQLAEKRDFISGFTALHWAAKCGNSDMLVKIIDVSRDAGVDIDINAKAHSGHTPLHIAALHSQGHIMALLVGEYGANVSVRDNCGKKAYHYLHKDASGTLRDMMMGGLKAPQAQDRVLHEKDELDLNLDLSRGRHSISRLFQPHVAGHKKKDKPRSGFYSLSSEPGEDREDRSTRNRIVYELQFACEVKVIEQWL
ncbi:hypothetical protein Q5P01_019163 [Channa striata]|uniref:SOWAHA-C winged helix-turn-helix domain-containing protein n=1 Tax=Channa striata TaxID=64152 RepID=A0AA88M0S6_CHASR|nr:hypothetical protein Q5P01_019163 [Channa striata]